MEEVKKAAETEFENVSEVAKEEVKTQSRRPDSALSCVFLHFMRSLYVFNIHVSSRLHVSRESA